MGTLTAEVKSYALRLGADLVGVGNIERWDKCPIIMSPKGIMPDARSVIVCGMHHGDGVVEMGGEKGPHIRGPYRYSFVLNMHLDHIAFNVARYLEDKGFKAIPIANSNIWRYRPYKDLKSSFAPDMSNIYAAVAAGLAEMGYNGLALTPQYGPRNRFISIITDAPLEPNPLLPGDTLCDNCKLCVKYCAKCGEALVKEVSGLTYIEIEGRRYHFANKNLWRCGWSEHFQLDAELPKPDKVDESVILDYASRYGLRTGAMGYCLKYCLPKQIRRFEPEYTSSPRRIRHYKGESLTDRVRERLFKEIVSRCFDCGIKMIATLDSNEAAKHGVDPKKYMPNATHIMLFMISQEDFPIVKPEHDYVGWWRADGMVYYLLHRGAYLAMRILEDAGYDATPDMILQDTIWKDDTTYPELVELLNKIFGGERYKHGAFLVTNAPIGNRVIVRDKSSLGDVGELGSDKIKELAREFGADFVGISSAERVNRLAEQVKSIYDGELKLEVRDKNPFFTPFNPDVTERKKKVLTTDDYLPGAKSVIVLGIRIMRESVRRLGQPPAEAIGPYNFARYQASRELCVAALRLVRILRSMGYNAALSEDLTGTAVLAGGLYSPRSVFSNRFAALAAGCGMLSKAGFLVNDRFGKNVRTLSIITDAELEEDSLNIDDKLKLRASCDSGCDLCVRACPVGAFNRGVATIEFAGKKISFMPTEHVRCEWATRYGLVAEEGFKFAGSTVNVMPPEKITKEALEEALRKQDPILKFRPCLAEMCAIKCPLEGECN